MGSVTRTSGVVYFVNMASLVADYSSSSNSGSDSDTKADVDLKKWLIHII